MRLNLWDQIVWGVSEALVPSAYADPGQGGVTVYLEGPVNRTSTTDDNGDFVFTGLPAGDYQLRFEYNGQEVGYRGERGQIASITVGDNEIVDMGGIRISGGHVNIGNVRVQELPEENDTGDGQESASTIWYSGVQDALLFHQGPGSLFDVNNDGETDFRFAGRPTDNNWYCFPETGTAAVGPLSAGVLIDGQNPSSGWFSDEQFMVTWLTTDSIPPETATAGGEWAGVLNGYMGLAFVTEMRVSQPDQSLNSGLK